MEGLAGGDGAVPTLDLAEFHDPRLAFRGPLPFLRVTRPAKPTEIGTGSRFPLGPTSWAS